MFNKTELKEIWEWARKEEAKYHRRIKDATEPEKATMNYAIAEREMYKMKGIKHTAEKLFIHYEEEE